MGATVHNLFNKTMQNAQVGLEATAVAQPAIFYSRHITLFCFGKRLSKYKMTMNAENSGTHVTPGYAYGRLFRLPSLIPNPELAVGLLGEAHVTKVKIHCIFSHQGYEYHRQVVQICIQ